MIEDNIKNMNDIKIDVTNVSDYLDEIIKTEKEGQQLFYKDLNEMYPYQMIPFNRGEIFSKIPTDIKPCKHSFVDSFTFNETPESTPKNRQYIAIHNIMFYERDKPFNNILWNYIVNSNGEMQESKYPAIVCLDKDGEPILDKEWTMKNARAASALTRTICLAISFMNCKNIEYADEPKKELKEKHNKKKHKKNPKTIYKVLVIDPLKKILKTEGDIEHNGIKKALHICRGHFREYGSDKPLFGKIEGRFWISQHTRGDAKYGTVEKDYKVKI